MRKILFSLLVLSFSQSFAFAATWDNLQLFKWPTCNIPQNEWRIGVGIGLEYLSIEAKIKEKFPFGRMQFGDQEQTQKHFQVSPSFEIGKAIFNDYYAGILISGHYSQAKKKSRAPLRNASYFKNTFKMDYYFDILAKLGYKIMPKTMAYILVGPSFAKWSHTTDQMEYNFRRGQEIKKDSFRVSGTTPGVGLGVGVEQIICKNIALSVNYTHHIYSSKKGKKYMRYIDNVYEPPELFHGDASKQVKPSSDAIVVRLSYFF